MQTSNLAIDDGPRPSSPSPSFSSQHSWMSPERQEQAKQVLRDHGICLEKALARPKDKSKSKRKSKSKSKGKKAELDLLAVPISESAMNEEQKEEVFSGKMVEFTPERRAIEIRPPPGLYE